MENIQLSSINALQDNNVCAVVGAHFQHNNDIRTSYCLHVAMKNTPDVMLVKLPVSVGKQNYKKVNDSLSASPVGIIAVTFNDLVIRKYTFPNKTVYSGTASNFRIMEEYNDGKTNQRQ